MLHILAKTATPSSKCKEICSSRIIISYIGSSNDGELQNQKKKRKILYISLIIYVQHFLSAIKIVFFFVFYALQKKVLRHYGLYWQNSFRRFFVHTRIPSNFENTTVTTI